MGEGQKFVNYLLATPIGRVRSLLAFIAAVWGAWSHQFVATGICLEWFLGVQGIGIAAWAYDRKKNKTT